CYPRAFSGARVLRRIDKMSEFLVFGFIPFDVFVTLIAVTFLAVYFVVFIGLQGEVNRIVHQRGRHTFFWFLVSLVLTPLGALLGLWLVGDNPYKDKESGDEG